MVGKENYRYRFFIKFGKLEHLENFRNRGQLYFNTMDNFRSMPEENLIGDPFEGITNIKQFGEGELTIKHEGKDLKLLVNNMFEYPTTQINGNIFCLYGADEKHLEQFLIKNEGNLPLTNVCKDYEHMLFINNPKGFMEKLTNRLELTGYKYRYGPVKYIDFNKHQGPLDQFCKRIKYKDQNEVRIWLENDLKVPITLEIGDISEFCTISRTENHNNLKFKVI